jgi:hypothetical protein
MSQAQSQAWSPAQGQGLGQPGDAGVSPLRLFGKMLKFFRNRAGLTSDQLGARVHLSGSAIRKIETGRQPPTTPARSSRPGSASTTTRSMRK